MRLGFAAHKYAIIEVGLFPVFVQYHRFAAGKIFEVVIGNGASFKTYLGGLCKCLQRLSRCITVQNAEDEGGN